MAKREAKAQQSGKGEKSGNRLERHPLSLEFSLPMSQEERLSLGKDISRNGQHQEIILYQGMVLDGWERYMACLQHGVTPKFKTYEGHNPGAVAFGTNAHRRKLSSVQKALLGARYLLHAQGEGEQVTQKEVAASVQVSLQRMNEVVQLLRSSDKECKRAAAELAGNPDITNTQLQQLLIDCGIVKPAAPKSNAVTPATRVRGPDDEDFDPDDPDGYLDSSLEGGDDEDIDRALSGSLDDLDPDDDDDMPRAKGASREDGINLLTKNGSKRVGHNHRPTETPASRVAAAFKGLTEMERLDFVRFSWGMLRPAMEKAIEQGRIEWALVAAHAEPGKAAAADMARALGGGSADDLDAALMSAAADGQAAPAATGKKAAAKVAASVATAAIDKAAKAAANGAKAPTKARGSRGRAKAE